MTFASGSLRLAGTLQVPEAEGSTGRRPAVVLVHGSGPQSRDAEIAGQAGMSFGCTVELFEELADGLEAAGFVVLRYDKRTCGPFNDCADNGYPFPSVTHVIHDLVKDAGAAAKWLATQREVDASRVYVVGHSEGGQLVPRLLTDVRELKGGVMLAAPFQAIDAVMAWQVAFIEGRVRASGKDDEETEAALKRLQGEVAALGALRAGTYEGATIAGVPVVYWRSWMKLGDEAPALAVATPKPILVLSGSYDWNVPPEETEAWKKAFALAPETKAVHQTKVLPCVTHAMSCIAQPDATLLRPSDIDCSVDPRTIDSVVQFLQAH